MLEQKHTLLVGFDLCSNKSQISCFNKNTFEPVSLIADVINDSEMISMDIAVNVKTGEWYFGEEAVDNSAFSEDITLLENFLDYVKKGETIPLGDNSIDSVEVLARFFRKYLSILKRYFPSETIKKIVVTVEKSNAIYVKTIFKALEKIGIEKERVSVIDHSISYVYYALSQKKELWMNDVALFDFGSEGLKYYQLSIDRKHRPITVSVVCTDYSQQLSMDLFGVIYVEQLRYIFETISRECLYKQIVSTIYVTGKGFEKSWADGVIKNLCVGRRAFKGQNLFCAGACYAAREISGEANHFEDYMFLNEDMIKGSVSVKAYADAKDSEIYLVKTGTAWYEAELSADFILDDETPGTKEVEVIVRNDLLNAKSSYIIALEGLNVRPNKTTRLKIRVKFIDATTCVLTIKDMGFGDFAKATNRVWEKVIEMI
ncbi:MAG: hypothetical protein IJD02_04735 [Lachnospiraceae bacterium]|nr:hypothetical protein [Lachnospiraceae bacterium]